MTKEKWVIQVLESPSGHVMFEFEATTPGQAREFASEFVSSGYIFQVIYSASSESVTFIPVEKIPDFNSAYPSALSDSNGKKV